MFGKVRGILHFNQGVALCNAVRSLSSRVDLAGVFPPIVTPFDKNEEVSLEKLRENLSVWKQIPFKGYTVLGSNGEFQYLTIQEKCDIVSTVRNEEPDKTLIVGAGHESTKITKEYVAKLAACGADVALVYTPCFYRGSMNHGAFVRHYTDIADSSPIPVILYNVPGNTSLDLPVDTVSLLAQHSNIIGLKESGGSVVRIGQIVHNTRHADFQVVAGSAGFMLPAYSVGAVGAVAALANVMGHEVCELHEKITRSSADALPLQHRLIAPNTAVTAGFGVTGLKFVCDSVGLYGGPCRSPIQPLTSDQITSLSGIMIKVGIKC